MHGCDEFDEATHSCQAAEVDLPRKDEKPSEEVGEPGKDEQQLGEKERETREDKEQLAKATEKKDPDGNSKSSIIVVEDVDTTTPPKSPELWLSFDCAQLTIADRDLITCGDELNNKHIAFSQAILKKQHVELSGLPSHLMLPKQSTPITASNALLILHCRGNHWIVITTIGCCPGSVEVFESLHSSTDQATHYYSIVRLKLMLHVYTYMQVQLLINIQY